MSASSHCAPSRFKLHRKSFRVSGMEKTEGLKGIQPLKFRHAKDVPPLIRKAMPF